MFDLRRLAKKVVTPFRQYLGRLTVADRHLRGEGLEIVPLNGVANLVEYRERVVEVPVQDARTNHLIHLLAVQLKKYVDRYPKLR